MSRDQERAEDRVYEAWKAERRLLADLIKYALARAPRCHVCPEVAYWRWTDRRPSGARDHIACDKHKHPDAIPITGSDVLRRALIAGV